MKIVDKRKFVRSICVTIGLIVLLILMLSNISFSHTEVSYKEIAISEGDTLWNIAKYEKNNNMYFKDKDIRDIVDEIKQTNDLVNSKLNIGLKLSIPIF